MTRPPHSPTSASPSRLPAWRFWLPMLVQIGSIFALSADAIHTHFYGKRVMLQTALLAPPDGLSGYRPTLSYDISRSRVLENLPGWEMTIGVPASNSAGTPTEEITFYVLLVAPPANMRNPDRPLPWKPIRVSRILPANLSERAIAIQGRYLRGSITYGLETYYLPPEGQRSSADCLLEVRVDDRGNAVPVGIWVGDRRYPL